MVYYPIFLDLRSRHVLVAGGGTVALRKARGLAEAGARITVVAPVVREELRAVASEVHVRPYAAADCAGKALIFAATDQRAVNARIGRDAAALGIPANIADAPEECGFIVPARFHHGAELQVAVSTGGTDPRRAVAIRDRIRDFVTEVILGESGPGVRT